MKTIISILSSPFYVYIQDPQEPIFSYCSLIGSVRQTIAMGEKASTILLAMILIIIALLSNDVKAKETTQTSLHDNDIDMKLKLLNKPAVKSIQVIFFLIRFYSNN